MLSSGDDNDSASEAEDSSLKKTTGQSQLEAAINSLSGLHAVKMSSSALRTAEKEANAGLSANARKVVASMRKKPKFRKPSQQKASSSASHQGSSTVFEVRAVVLYTQGCISVDEDSGRYVFDEPIRPLTNEGLLHELEQEGRVKFNVRFDRAWSSGRVHQAFQAALPGFFKYLKGQGQHSDNHQDYVLCYPESRKLCVHTSAEPTGEQLYGVKSRKGRGKSESFIHIALIESVPADVLRCTSWLPSMNLPDNSSDGEDISRNTLSNSDTSWINGKTTKPSAFEHSLSGTPTPIKTASKGKKRAIEAVSDEDSEIEIAEGPLKTPKLTLGAKQGSLLSRLDKALARLPASSKVKIEPTTVARPRPRATERTNTKSTTPVKMNNRPYRFKNAPVFSRTPSPMPTALKSDEPLFPIIRNAANNRSTMSVTRPLPVEASSSGTRHSSPPLPPSQPFQPVAGPLTPSHHTAVAAHASSTPLHHSPGRWERPSDMSDPWAS
ncbi:hypothetical protein BC835DRAFT_1422564 [Cytidiella melzeri]|nr:hypothetical protein BC835DRAFT_1422564 [Cytidiella melzeri]